MKAIAYYRVSTQKQGESGLGLDAQRSDVERYADQNAIEIIQEYTEIETGTSKKYRPQLDLAIRQATANDAVLLVAKLDRLARSVAFTAALLESGIRFKAMDMPEADNFTIHIIAAMAEREAQLISARTKAALKAKRERDGEWRRGRISEANRRKGNEAMRAIALDHHKQAVALAVEYIEQGKSLRAIAQRLNDLDYTAQGGGEYHANTVKRMLDRV